MTASKWAPELYYLQKDSRLQLLNSMFVLYMSQAGGPEFKTLPSQTKN